MQLAKPLVWRIVVVAAGCAGIVAPAYAGYKSAVPVNINLVARTAEGSIGSARNSLDPLQQIGCYSTADVNAATPASGSLGLGSTVAHCFAVNSIGQSVSCTYPIPTNYRTGPIAGMPKMVSNAYLKFTWDASNNCTSIQVYPSSAFEPKLL